MKFRSLLAPCSSLALASALSCAALLAARAQTADAEQTPAPLTAAVKLDEFAGEIGYCNYTARLDNFAIALQNLGGAKGFVVAYTSPGGRPADSRLRMWRYYLIHERGLGEERLFFHDAGVRAEAEALTAELWLVPEGAPPPVPSAALEQSRRDFSGRLESYVTSEDNYHEPGELGPSYESLAMRDFAEKLKRQTDSKGYVVIRTPKESPPGAAGRLARRETRRLEKEHETGAARVTAIDGGNSDGAEAVVELWILPKDAPPPPGVAEKLERVMSEPFRINALEYYDKPDADEAEWILENLAEALRGDPNSQAAIIVRAHPPEEEGEEAESGGASEGEGEEGAADGEGETELVDARDLAEQWRRELVEKRGFELHRVVVMLGRPSSGSGARLEVWVAPPKAMLPDPFVVTKDEETEESYHVEEEASEQPPLR